MKGTILLLFVFGAISVQAQYAEKEAVEQVVYDLFHAMRKSDTTTMRNLFTTEATMFSAFVNQEGNPVLREGDLNGFLTSVGTPHDQVYDEPIWNIKTEIDGVLAQVWCDYAFYLGDNFSHCGVDAFQLFKSADGWKIFHITDTRRRSDCDIPEEIKANR